MGLLGRIRKNKQLYNLVEQKSNGKTFCLKNKFLKFSETKKFNTELQPLVSYKRVSYKKNTCISHLFLVFLMLTLNKKMLAR